MLNFSQWQSMLGNVFGCQVVKGLKPPGADERIVLHCKLNQQSFRLDIEGTEEQTVTMTVNDKEEVFHGPDWVDLLRAIKCCANPDPSLSA